MVQMNCHRKLQRDISLRPWAPEESINHQGSEYKRKLHEIAPQQDRSPSMPFYGPCTRVSNHKHHYKNTEISSYDTAASHSTVTQFQEPILQQLIMA